MVKRVESILEQALILPVSDRATVIRKLIESLDDVAGGCGDITSNDDQAEGDAFFSDPAVEQAWAEEIQRRVERMERGEMAFTPGRKTIARIREQLRRSRDAKD